MKRTFHVAFGRVVRQLLPHCGCAEVGAHFFVIAYARAANRTIRAWSCAHALFTNPSELPGSAREQCAARWPADFRNLVSLVLDLATRGVGETGGRSLQSGLWSTWVRNWSA